MIYFWHHIVDKILAEGEKLQSSQTLKDDIIMDVIYLD